VRLALTLLIIFIKGLFIRHSIGPCVPHLGVTLGIMAENKERFGLPNSFMVIMQKRFRAHVADGANVYHLYAETHIIRSLFSSALRNSAVLGIG
jgi:hypothetical protein